MFSSTQAPSEPAFIDLTAPQRRSAGPASPMESPSASPPPPFSPLNPHPLFHHPDLLPYLLDNPVLAPSDLLSLGSVNRQLREAVAKRLFRNISLSTPNRAIRLSTLILGGSPFLKHVEEVTVAFGAPLALEREIFHLLEVQQAVEEADDASTVEECEKHVGANDLAMEVINDAFGRWPFVDGGGAAFIDLFLDLSSTVTVLNFAPPVSHYLLQLLPVFAFAKSTSIKTL